MGDAGLGRGGVTAARRAELVGRDVGRVRSARGAGVGRGRGPTVPPFYGAPDSVRSRNLAADPRLVVHLESASDVLILHGTAAMAGPAGADLAVNAAYAAKYTDPTDLEYLPDAPANETSLLLRRDAAARHRVAARQLGRVGEPPLERRGLSSALRRRRPAAGAGAWDGAARRRPAASRAPSS